VLSVPCSTGEEPYSLALTLDDAAIGPDRWDILGVDLSGQAIEHARQARYSGLAFRELTEEQRARWFRAEGSIWRLHVAACKRVRFQTGNLTDPAFLREERPFDAILCRNLLIYLNTAASGKALAALDRLLAANGTLCLGHAEPWGLVHERFQRVGDEGLFLFVRRRGKREEPRREMNWQPQPIPPRPVPAPVTVVAPAPTPNVAAGGLAEARRLADLGDLNSALERCRQVLKLEPPSADALALTGVVHLARREANEALICLRKALYLEPDHREALEHLLVLSAQLGDQAQARLLRQRLERVREGGKS
jgi:chemotaxis protein methyltransferase WspC